MRPLESSFRRGQKEAGAEAPGWYLLPAHEATGRMVLASGDMWGPCRVGAALPLPWELWGRWTSESTDLLVARGECSAHLPPSSVRRQLCRGLWHP